MEPEHSADTHNRDIASQHEAAAGDDSLHSEPELKLAVRGDNRIDYSQSQQLEPQGVQSPRKRRRTSRMEDPHADLDGPLKRRKGNFNASYLTFFNDHVTDVATKAPHQFHAKLRGSQIGLSEWSSTEKETLFAAITRIGRDNLRDLASLVQSKSELEIRQYLMLVHDASIDRREGQVGRHGVLKLKSHPSAVEVDPELCNALESVADDLALRQEAHEDFVEQQRWGDEDWLVDIALARSFEDRLKGDNPSVPHFAELFNTRKWLQLSENVFMNSIIEDCNWRSAASGRPAIRATAMEDFYSLVKSITRRLIATTLTVANSRIRRRKEVTSGKIRPRDVKAARSSIGMDRDISKFWTTAPRRLRLNVHNNDKGSMTYGALLDASATTPEPLDDGGITEGTNSDDDRGLDSGRESHASYEENHPDCAPDEEYNMQEGNQREPVVAEEPTYMNYDEVEAELGFPKIAVSIERPDELEETDEDTEEELGDDVAEEDNDEHSELFGNAIRDAHDHDSGSEYDNLDERGPLRAPARRAKQRLDLSTPDEDLLVDMHEVEQDLYEAIHHSAVDFAGTTRAKETLMIRIRNEHRQQVEAEKLDASLSKMEEARLWAIVREEEVPEEEPDMGIDAGMSSAPPTTDDEAYDTAADTRTIPGAITKESEEWYETDWRAKLHYCNDWELTPGGEP